MTTLITLEFRKLIGFRSVRLALLVMLLLPWLWTGAAQLYPSGLARVYNLALISGWQVPALLLMTTTQFLLPLFIAMTCAELLGSEISAGTLAPLLLRPISRSRLMGAKLVVALVYPALLLLALLVGSLLAGLPFGLGGFVGGSGLGPGGFVGQGPLSAGAALAETLRGYGLAAITLMPVAALSLLCAVIYLNTAAAALATVAALSIMRLLVIFPDNFQKLLLTTHLGMYLDQNPGSVGQSLLLLIIYTVGFSLLAIFTFERKDV